VYLVQVEIFHLKLVKISIQDTTKYQKNFMDTVTSFYLPDVNLALL